MSDGIDISTVQIHNSHDVRSWPATATISKLEFRPTGVHVEHTKQAGPASWPDFVPPGWDGPLQYTLWIFLRIGGTWHGSGCIQFWRTCDQNGGPPEQFAQNWYYAPDRWAPMTGHQPQPGELVGFMVSAGDARNSGVQTVHERSNIVAMPFPTGGTVYMPAPVEEPPVVPSEPVVPPVPVPPPMPAPLPSPVTPVAPAPVTPAVVQPLEGLDELRQQIAELTKKVDALLARTAPVYRGKLPAVPALGISAATVVLKSDAE